MSRRQFGRARRGCSFYPSLSLAKQSLFCGCFLPGPRRFLRGSAYCSELLAKKLADSYPKIICILIDAHGIALIEHIH